MPKMITITVDPQSAVMIALCVQYAKSQLNSEMDLETEQLIRCAPDGLLEYVNTAMLEVGANIEQLADTTVKHFRS